MLRLSGVVNPALPVNTVQELIAYVKSNPRKVNGASFGTATNAHCEVMNGPEGLHLAGVNKHAGLGVVEPQPSSVG